MSECEFVGGPLDGRRREMSGLRDGQLVDVVIPLGGNGFRLVSRGYVNHYSAKYRASLPKDGDDSGKIVMEYAEESSDE